MKNTKDIMILVSFVVSIATSAMSTNSFAEQRHFPKAPHVLASVANPSLNLGKASAFSETQQTAIKGIVKQYIQQHPEVVMDAIYTMREKQLQDHIQYAQKVIRERATDVFNAPHDLVFGDLQGAVTLVEFLDYQCTHCKAMHDIVDALKAENPKLRIVIKELPIFGDSSVLGAKAVMAAYQQSPVKAWSLHKLLLAEKNALTDQRIWQLAEKVQLNLKRLKKVSQSKEIADRLEKTQTLANSMRVMGTPVFVVGRRDGMKFTFVPGATSKAHLNELIKQMTHLKSQKVVQEATVVSGENKAPNALSQ